MNKEIALAVMLFLYNLYTSSREWDGNLVYFPWRKKEINPFKCISLVGLISSF
jgi:hypothetical protein